MKAMRYGAAGWIAVLLTPCISGCFLPESRPCQEAVSDNGQRVAVTWQSYWQMQLPDAGKVATACYLRWADLSKPDRLHTIMLPHLELMESMPLTLSPTGTYAAIDNDLLVHLESGRKVHLAQLLGAKPQTIWWRGNEVFCALAEGNHDIKCNCDGPQNLVRILLTDGRAGPPQQVPVDSIDTLRVLVVSPNGRYILLTNPPDGKADSRLPAILDIDTGRATTLDLRISQPSQAGWTPDSSKLLVQDKSRVCVYELASAKATDLTAQMKQATGRIPTSLEWAADNNHLLDSLDLAADRGDAFWISLEPWSVVSLKEALRALLEPGEQPKLVSLSCRGWLEVFPENSKKEWSSRTVAVSYDLKTVVPLPAMYTSEPSPTEPAIIEVTKDGKVVTHNVESLPR